MMEPDFLKENPVLGCFNQEDPKLSQNDVFKNSMKNEPLNCFDFLLKVATK